MIHRLTILVLSVVVLLLITERKSVTRVTPVTPAPKRKDAHVIKSDDDDEVTRWNKRNQDAGDIVRSHKLAAPWSDENE